MSDEDLSARLAQLDPSEREAFLALLPPTAETSASAMGPGAGSPTTESGDEIHATRTALARWEADYGTKRRGLFRWIAHGRARGDPCPLDEPAKMPGWWARNMKHTLPDKISLAAAKVKQVVDQEKTLSAGGSVESQAAPPPRAASLAGSEVVEGEAVKQARQIVGMCFQKLSEALGDEPPDLDSAQLWQVRWEKSVEALRKQERDDRDAQKQNGELLPRGPVLGELAQLIEALRLAHNGMCARILAELGRQADGRARRVLALIEKPLAAAIETVRSRETDLFLNVESLGTRAAAQGAFTLAA